MKSTFSIAPTILLLMLAPLYGETLPELQQGEDTYTGVEIDAWVKVPGREVRNVQLDSSSGEVVDSVVSYLKGLDCVQHPLVGPLATSDIVSVTLRTKGGESLKIDILTGNALRLPNTDAFYRIRNVSPSAGIALMRKLMADFPELIKEVPRKDPA